MKLQTRQRLPGVILAAGLAATGVASIAETPVGMTVESRILLGFKVDDAGVATMLPDGWQSVTLPRGPVGGSNLIVALIDRHVMLDADGKPGTPSSGPTVALLAYGRTEGVEGVRGFVTHVYEEAPVVDPYGTSALADINRVAGFVDAGGGAREQSEVWTILPDAGGSVEVTLDFKVAGYGWSTGGESRPFSAANPDFSRIYRYDQLAGLAMNKAMGRELDGTASFSASDPELAAVFDGSEELVSIVTIPTYVRTITLP